MIWEGIKDIELGQQDILEDDGGKVGMPDNFGNGEQGSESKALNGLTKARKELTGCK
jgi:hypothetical protein